MFLSVCQEGGWGHTQGCLVCVGLGLGPASPAGRVCATGFLGCLPAAAEAYLSWSEVGTGRWGPRYLPELLLVEACL